MGANMVKITQTNTRYVVETADGRLHVLNEKALKWNLKRVFGLNSVAIKQIMICLNQAGVVEFDLSWCERQAS